ncbi:MAG: hypothetical protein AAF502_14140 [Bacteroidota bacterium]
MNQICLLLTFMLWSICTAAQTYNDLRFQIISDLGGSGTALAEMETPEKPLLLIVSSVKGFKNDQLHYQKWHQLYDLQMVTVYRSTGNVSEDLIYLESEMVKHKRTFEMGYDIMGFYESELGQDNQVILFNSNRDVIWQTSGKLTSSVIDQALVQVYGKQKYSDKDEDGVFDTIDECKKEPGTWTNNGCPEDQSTPPHQFEAFRYPFQLEFGTYKSFNDLKDLKLSWTDYSETTVGKSWDAKRPTLLIYYGLRSGSEDIYFDHLADRVPVWQEAYGLNVIPVVLGSWNLVRRAYQHEFEFYFEPTSGDYPILKLFDKQIDEDLAILFNPDGEVLWFNRLGDITEKSERLKARLDHGLLDRDDTILATLDYYLDISDEIPVDESVEVEEIVNAATPDKKTEPLQPSVKETSVWDLPEGETWVSHLNLLTKSADGSEYAQFLKIMGSPVPRTEMTYNEIFRANIYENKGGQYFLWNQHGIDLLINTDGKVEMFRYLEKDSENRRTQYSEQLPFGLGFEDIMGNVIAKIGEMEKYGIGTKEWVYIPDSLKDVEMTVVFNYDAKLKSIRFRWKP